MAAKSKKRLTYGEYTVAIVCPLEVEMSAARYMLDDEHARLPNKDGDPNRYILGQMSGHSVAIAFLPQGAQGIGAAATVATDMRRTFPAIQLRLLVGVGRGIPSKKNDIRLGDVVVGMPDGTHGGVVQYDLGKEKTDGFERKGFLCQPPDEWRTAVVEMQSDHRIKSRISEFLTEMLSTYPELQRYSRPAPEKDILFSPDNIHVKDEPSCDKCDKDRVVPPRSLVGPQIFYGTIASGNKVIKNAEIRDKISNSEGGALCFEMEAAGLSNGFPCVVIRGICGYADSHKNDEWQPYGAAVAAACAKELLTYIDPIIKKAPKPTTYSVIPQPRLMDFVGREDELQQILSFFSDSDTPDTRMLILHALGGQGKSQIALKYCQLARTTYRGIFWVNASSESAAMQSFVIFAQEIDRTVAASLSSDQDRVQFVLTNLERWSDRWMLVFDNYDDPKSFPDLLQFIPSAGHGDVLITTRHQSVKQLGTVIEIPPMPTDKAVELLLRG